MTQFSLDLVSQLTEIHNAGVRRGKPDLVGDAVVELISRLTSGGVAGKFDDIREVQAKRYWDLGVGRELGFSSFEAYLASIPQLPTAFNVDNTEFPIRVLVETRIGLKRLCEIGNIAFEGNDETFIAYDERYSEFKQPTWIRIQDGRKNRNRSVKDCRKNFAKYERGLTALRGVCAYLQHAEVVSEWTKDGAHVMDLSGSVLSEIRGFAAFLGVDEGRAKLYWHWLDFARSKYGSASSREC
jgi:hypothetical protein